MGMSACGAPPHALHREVFPMNPLWVCHAWAGMALDKEGQGDTVCRKQFLGGRYLWACMERIGKKNIPKIFGNGG